MKTIKNFITGCTFLITLVLMTQNAHALDVCNPLKIKNHYMEIYCGIRLDGNEAVDKKIVEILSKQFSMDKDVIKEILANTICETVQKDPNKLKVTDVVQAACSSLTQTSDQALTSWTVFSDIRNAYQKEKLIRQSEASLEFKFKNSEQYWDGEIGTVSGAPFDLIVDLNLIDIVLFGSQAQWMNDVFSFPTKEESAPEGLPKSDSGAPKSDEQKPKLPSTPDKGDPGIKLNVGKTPALPPGCVLLESEPRNRRPADNQGGSPGPAPSSFCGNGVVDVLLAEQCDDGNIFSGDGCDQNCKKEITEPGTAPDSTSNGTDKQCIDPDSIVFKRPEDVGLGKKDSSDQNTGASGNASGQAECPPGSVAKPSTDFTGTESQSQEIPQSQEYPGPYIGGTMKQFPDSQRPECGPGQSAVEITVAGKKETMKNDDGNVRCVPTALCKDFNDARDFLFGKGWQDDEEKSKVAMSIEALFCVNVTKANRPLSPYNMNDGCIDCHIMAMTDAVEKALQTNVSPLENTMSAFSISNKFGPKFSFNLIATIKSKLKFKPSATSQNAIKQAEKATKFEPNKCATDQSVQNQTTSPLGQLEQEANCKEGERLSAIENNRIFKTAGEAISDQELGGRINPLIIQMRDSFANIESKFEGMVTSTNFNEKEQCQP